MLAVNPYAMKDAGYNPPTDIAPVCLAVDFSNVLVVHPSVPAHTLADYLALGRRPEGIDYGTAGIGSAGHLAGELLRVRSGAQLNHVPFRGGGPAMNDLMAGHVASAMASGPTATNAVREGPHPRARPDGAPSARRSIPTSRPSPNWASPAMPRPTGMRWWCRRRCRSENVGQPERADDQGADAPEVRAAYAQQGMVTLGGTIDEAAAYIARETEIWKKVDRRRRSSGWNERELE